MTKWHSVPQAPFSRPRAAPPYLLCWEAASLQPSADHFRYTDHLVISSALMSHGKLPTSWHSWASRLLVCLQMGCMESWAGPGSSQLLPQPQLHRALLGKGSSASPFFFQLTSVDFALGSVSAASGSYPFDYE